MVSYADQLYLMQLEFQKCERERRDAAARDFQAIREEARRLQEEREARQVREGQEDAAPQQGSWEPWEPREFQIDFDDDE